MRHQLRGVSAGSSKMRAASVDELTALLNVLWALKKTMRDLAITGLSIGALLWQ